VKNKGSGILFVFQDSIFLLQNNKGIWEIPGGKKDAKESFLQAAQRETFEEVGICPKFNLIGKYIYENNKNKFKIFIGTIPAKFPVKISDEHIRGKWFNIKKLPQYLHKKILGAIDLIKNSFSTGDNINAI
jgi:8-oxo-dGTP pyrophosphatase MutT (NUDIX family)